MQPGKIEMQQDPIAEKLDEMADLCEYWKKNREKGRNSNALRTALLILADELIVMRDIDRIPPGEFAKNLKSGW